MLNKTGIPRKFRNAFLRWRWLFIALAALGVIVVEITEYQMSLNLAPNQDLRYHFLVIGMAIAVMAVALISFSRKGSRVASAIQSISLQRLIQVENLDELTDVLLEVAHTLVPLLGASFFLYDQNKKEYEMIDQWSMDVEGKPRSFDLPFPNLDSLAIDMIKEPPPLGIFIPGSPGKPPGSGKPSVFLLPMPYRDSQIALLCLYFPPEASFSKKQINILNKIALEMMLVIERVQLRNLLAVQTDAIQAEHTRIARHIHDTLAHNLAYLRLKLDELSGEETLRDIAAFRFELERMRDIADQAYDQVRNSLADLSEDTPADLNSVVYEYAIEVGNRAHFQVHTHTIGEPKTLPPHYRHQLFYILKEVLRNIEKHAGARQVNISFVWKTKDLSITVSDDGRGFDPAEVQPGSGHYGIRIMKECAEEINAEFNLTSTPKGGTQVCILLPLHPT